MKTASFLKLLFSSLWISVLFIFSNCGGGESEKPESKEPDPGQLMDVQSPAERGRYLVIMGGCDDCHSPKIMTDHGPMVDSTRRLSGHPADAVLPKYDPKMLKPGGVFMCSQDLTAWIGPWGVSFPFNLTPDKETGTGNWTADLFIKIMRTGKHMGAEAARPILPPMPWQNIGQLTDDDLKAIFAFLQTLPPIRNKVPDPIPPAEIANK